METKKKSEQTGSQKFTSGTSLTEEEFKKGIEDAEKGPFYSVQESMNQFESWLKKRENK
ncbi:MAG: hypothetical protein U5K72_14485 [Balneolaceae bacterium]|nr:hypothetical protein [Balneolaceae bacterium]